MEEAGASAGATKSRLNPAGLRRKCLPDFAGPGQAVPRGDGHGTGGWRAAGRRDRRRRGHTHIAELLPILEKYQKGRRWFLQHTSLATDPAELRRILAASSLTDYVVVHDSHGQGKPRCGTPPPPLRSAPATPPPS